MFRLGSLPIKADHDPRPAPLIEAGVELTRHAINRAFERCHERYEETKLSGESALTWLARQVREALAKGEKDANGVFVHNGLCFSIDTAEAKPRLKTVYPAGCYRSTDSAVGLLREKLLSVAVTQKG